MRMQMRSERQQNKANKISGHHISTGQRKTVPYKAVLKYMKKDICSSNFYGPKIFRPSNITVLEAKVIYTTVYFFMLGKQHPSTGQGQTSSKSM